MICVYINSPILISSHLFRVRIRYVGARILRRIIPTGTCTCSGKILHRADQSRAQPTQPPPRVSHIHYLCLKNIIRWHLFICPKHQQWHYMYICNKILQVLGFPNVKHYSVPPSAFWYIWIYHYWPHINICRNCLLKLKCVVHGRTIKKCQCLALTLTRGKGEE